jgi:hypothetical protein
MAREARIEAINQFGWRKEFVVDKAIVLIGSDERNDVVLNGAAPGEVLPRHAQVLPSTLTQSGFRLVNLSSSNIQVRTRAMTADAEAQVVGPRAATELGDGDRAQLGSFTLVFHSGEQRSEIMKLSIALASKTLTVDQPVEGAITLHHVGNKAGVQFRLEVEGIDPNLVEIGPGPVLFPNAEKQVPFRLFHPKGTRPPAGECRITFHALAPDAYPGERASVSDTIVISPYRKHRVRILTADAPE